MNLKLYKNHVENIRQVAGQSDISENEATQIFDNCFRILEVKYGTSSKRKHASAKYWRIGSTTVILVALLVCLVGIVDRRVFTTTIMRNVQNSIYPGLKVLRKIAVPIIRRYPSLSEYYDEWCLLENPYFRVSEMDCWPCSVVRSVPVLTGHNVSRSFNFGIPYTKFEEKTTVRMEELRLLYQKNYAVFEKDAATVISDDPTFRYARDVIESGMDSNPSERQSTHITWRVDRTAPGRILRKLFPRPANTPDWWEQSTEKFVLLDEPKSPPYSLPNPECANVAIRCARGARLIRMTPSPECSQSCETLTILLSAGNTLWYNWWYWRPVSLPASNATDFSIHYLTSFC